MTRGPCGQHKAEPKLHNQPSNTKRKVNKVAVQLLLKKKGYCVLALTLKSNCDFTLIFCLFVIYPYFLNLKTPLALLREQHVTVLNELEEVQVCPCEYARTFMRV